MTNYTFNSCSENQHPTENNSTTKNTNILVSVLCLYERYFYANVMVP